jgi:hypothetical protein
MTSLCPPLAGAWRALAAGSSAPTPPGCTEALMMAHGFPIEMLGDLAMAGLALATPKDTRAGRQPMLVVWMTITKAGRKAIA